MHAPLYHLPNRYSPGREPSYLPTYPDAPPEPVECPYCGTHTDEFCDVDYWSNSFEDYKKNYVPAIRDWIRAGVAPGKSHVRLDGSMLDQRASIFICPLCGWWVAWERALLPAVQWQLWCVTLFSSGVLEELSLTDIETPLHQVREYLVRHFDARHTLHPRLFEKTVASVFRDFGYDTTLTAYSCDGGIDVVLLGDNNERIGVQVKRSGRSIQVEQIRAFLGALTLGGYTRGIFVSTNKFQRGAIAAATQCTERHLPIELVDAESFFSMLGIARLNKSPDPDQCGFFKEMSLTFDLYSLNHLNTL